MTKAEDKEAVLPISVICSVVGDGKSSLKSLDEEVASAFAELEGRREDVGLKEYEKLAKEAAEADAELAECKKEFDQIEAERRELGLRRFAHERKASRVIERREDLEAAIKRTHVSDDDIAFVREAEARLSRAKRAREEGRARDAAEKRAKNEIMEALSKIPEARRFLPEEMVPLIAEELVGWYRDMRYGIDVPEKVPAMDFETLFNKNVASNRFDYAVRSTGQNKYIVLECMKDDILPLIHNMEGYEVSGMNERGDKHIGRVLTRSEWESDGDCEGMLGYCWKGNGESDEATSGS